MDFEKVIYHLEKSLVSQNRFPKNSLHARREKRKAVISSDFSCVNLSQCFVVRSQNLHPLYCTHILCKLFHLNYATAFWFYKMRCIHLIIE